MQCGRNGGFLAVTVGCALYFIVVVAAVVVVVVVVIQFIIEKDLQLLHCYIFHF